MMEERHRKPKGGICSFLFYLFISYLLAELHSCSRSLHPFYSLLRFFSSFPHDVDPCYPDTWKMISDKIMRIPGVRRLSSSVRPKKAVVLNKVTRYEFEKSRLSPDLSEDEFRRELLRRGSDYETIKYHYDIHKKSESRILRALENSLIEDIKVVQRFDYSTSVVDWADIIFTAGGDGTFLMGASKVSNNIKPVVGFNTDPTRSEGYLLLPKKVPPHEALRLIMDHKIEDEDRWYFRKRLRITLIGSKDKIYSPPIEIHQQKVTYPEYRFVEESTDSLKESESFGPEDVISERVVPVLALNEVFIGESLSSRVSNLEVKFDDDSSFFNSKNSGLCISTGTGSTSWTFNINKLTHQAVRKILKLTQSVTGESLNYDDPRFIETITSRFNNELIFEPDCSKMVYTLRDPVYFGTFPKEDEKRPRGLAQKVEVKSRCFGACLVIDGSLSFKFNDGTRAVIEMFDEDSLKTMFFR